MAAVVSSFYFSLNSKRSVRSIAFVSTKCMYFKFVHLSSLLNSVSKYLEELYRYDSSSKSCIESISLQICYRVIKIKY